MKKIFILAILLFIPVVLAAGGGGGGGGKVILPSYDDLKCDDHGVLSFTRSYELNPVVVISPAGKEITITGTWGYNKFISRESALILPGQYVLKDPEYGNHKVTCPGVRLSCAWVKLQVEECTLGSEGIKVLFSAINVSADDLQYKFSLDDTSRTLSSRKGSVSTQLQNMMVTPQDSDTYLISAPNLIGINTFEVSVPDCIGRSSVYSRKECSGDAQNTSAVDASTLQCGGYLDISDRVRCRLRLSYKEREEYNNSFPEECKVRSDAQACLETYEAVQECWDFPNGEARINCAKRVLKLGDILTEKANCNALDAGKRENCNLELKKKGYDLIKFRLYNLEQEAEKLINEGKLNETEVTNFVVKMEQSKVAFNLAQTKEEKRQILLQARQSWIELMRMVNK